MSFEPTGINVSDVAENEGTPVTIGGRRLLLYRVGEEVYATQRLCLHQGADLADGIVVDAHVVCPVHGWRFNVRTGVHTDSRYNCLRTYPVDVRAGQVYVDPISHPLPQEST